MQVAWIDTFLAIVERGGFCAAADSLFRSQSRVSAHIASLELALGAPLFDRRQRPVALTAAGQAFFEHATSAKASLDAGAAAVCAVKEGRAGRIALGAYAGTGAAFLPPLLADLARERPKLRVDIVEQPAAMLDRALLDGTVDIAVRPRVPRLAHSALDREPLWCERMVILVPRCHRLARASEVHLADLVGEPLITNDEAVAMLHDARFEPNVAFVSDQPSMLVACVARGLGIGFTNELALEAVPTDDAVVIELADPIERFVDVCWLGEIHDRSTTYALLNAIRRARLPRTAARSVRETGVLRLIKPRADTPELPQPSRRALAAGRA
jgi:DNA-binding transcriptional LysR family regulator